MSFISLFFLFLRIGAFTFGGGFVMLGFIEKELRATKQLFHSEIADMVVLATAFPGPVSVNMAFLAGKRLLGLKGAAIAVVGTVLPPFLSMLLLSKVLLPFLHESWLALFFLGATCAVAVIIGHVVYGMAKIAFLDGWRNVAAFSAVVFLLVYANVHPFAALGLGLSLRLLLGEEASS